MTTYKTFTDSDWRNCNFRVRGNHYKLLHEAAAKHDESAASYMRRVLITYAAADLGLDAPDLSPYSADAVSLAARRLGLTVKDFSELAIAEHARRVLGHLGQQDVVTRVSTELGNAVGLPPSVAPRNAAEHEQGRTVGQVRR